MRVFIWSVWRICWAFECGYDSAALCEGGTSDGAACDPVEFCTRRITGYGLVAGGLWSSSPPTAGPRATDRRSRARHL